MAKAKAKGKFPFPPKGGKDAKGKGKLPKGFVPFGKKK